MITFVSKRYLQFTGIDLLASLCGGGIITEVFQGASYVDISSAVWAA
jgi:hypothetical protein